MKLFEPPGGLHTGRWTVCLASGMLVACSSCPPCSFLKVLQESGAVVPEWCSNPSGEKGGTKT